MSEIKYSQILTQSNYSPLAIQKLYREEEHRLKPKEEEKQFVPSPPTLIPEEEEESQPESEPAPSFKPTLGPAPPSEPQVPVFKECEATIEVTKEMLLIFYVLFQSFQPNYLLVMFQNQLLICQEFVSECNMMIVNPMNFLAAQRRI